MMIYKNVVFRVFVIVGVNMMAYLIRDFGEGFILFHFHLDLFVLYKLDFRDLLRKADVRYIKMGREYIRKNFHQPITLSELARNTGTNETKLKVGFKKLYGKTFTEIVRDERLLKARHLIEEGNASIKEISLMCGYESTSMFSKRFKERYGLSPGQAARLKSG